MPIGIIRGPAGAGKSQWFQENREPGDLLIDVTALWVALLGLERDGNGRYPVRLASEPGLRMALYLKSTAIRFAAENGISGWATTSSSSPVAVERLREIIVSAGAGAGAGWCCAGAVGRVVTVDPGESVARSRLADPDTGEVSDECNRAVRRWYGRRR